MTDGIHDQNRGFGCPPIMVDRAAARTLTIKALADAALCWDNAHKAGAYNMAEAEVIADKLLCSLGYQPTS